MALLKNELKNRYTMIPNSLFNLDISEKAFKLAVYLYSKPNDWEFYQEFMAKELNTSHASVKRWVKELKDAGVLNITKYKSGSGFDYEYKLCIKSEPSESIKSDPLLGLKSDTHINTDITNTNNKEKINKKEKSIKQSYGEFKNVKLTDEEYTAVKEDYKALVDRAIEILDDYIESTGKKYKSHRAVLKKNGWVWDRLQEEYKSKKTKITKKTNTLPRATID